MTSQLSTSEAEADTHSTPAGSALLYTGIAAVISGGLISAITSPLSLELGSWVAAYLVLVAGVAQAFMGVARSLWHSPGTGRRGGWPQFTLWNLGNVGVIAGTLIGSPPVVVVSSALLVAALVLAFVATMGNKSISRRVLLLVYRASLIALAVSIPVGMVLSAIRNT